MKYLLFTFVLVYFSSIQVNSNLHHKCCGGGQRIVRKNSELKCDDLTSGRIQENFDDQNFLAKNTSGSCVEIFSEEKLAVFRMTNDDQVEKIEDLEDDFFPKCCLLDYHYNTVSHSCEKKEGKSVFGFLKKDSFVRIGLPGCEIIFDKILNPTDVRMDGKGLIFLKENEKLEANFCLDATTDNKLVVRICAKDIHICEKIMCIHKCCPDGQSFINRSVCKDTLTYGVDLTITEAFLAPHDPFAIIHGFIPMIHMLPLHDHSYQVDRFGVFSVYMANTDSHKHDEVFESGYCLEHTFIEGKNTVLKNEYMMFYHLPPPQLDLKFAVTRWIKLVSCFFLSVTISVYMFIPNLRNLFGEILLNYCLSTLIFFGSLVVSQFFTEDISDEVCTGIGYLSVLSSIWSFTWLNIMCVDIWRSFGTPRVMSGRLEKGERRTFLYYCLYGWGFPLFWVSMMAAFSVTKMMPEEMHPVVGEHKCYLENYDTQSGNYSYIIYVTLPLLLQQIVNTILFVKTVRYCFRVKGVFERSNDSERKTALKASKERLILIVKLALIMGILFMFETVSSFHNFRGNKFTTYVEVVWDSFNCMQGVFIFIIFVWEKKVYNSLCRIPGMTSRKLSVSSELMTAQLSMQFVKDDEK